MIIIDHGDNYYTVYGHIEEAFKTAGDVVEAGEVMATAGDTGSINRSPNFISKSGIMANRWIRCKWLENKLEPISKMRLSAQGCVAPAN